LESPNTNHKVSPEQELFIYVYDTATPLDGSFFNFVNYMKKIFKSPIRIITFVLLAFLIFFIFYFFQNRQIKPKTKNTEQNILINNVIEKNTEPPIYPLEDKKIDEEILKSITIIDTVEKISENTLNLITGDIDTTLKFTEGQTFYEILQNEENIKLISFDGKEYSGLGFFVTDIGNLHSKNGGFLVYYINGKEASVGVSSYIPQNGDIVLWKLK